MVTTEADALPAATDAVHRMLEAFDLACSRFREDSELAELNRAAGRPVRVSPLMLEAVQAGLRAAELTSGDVDPTLGSALLALGYDRDFSELGDGPPVLRFVSAPGWRSVSVDPGAETVTVARGVRLDLGATAKALAADHAAQAAYEAAGCGVLVGLGGDLRVCGPPPEAHGWRVRVTDDHRSGLDAPGQSITISTGGLATSSIAVRRWQAGERTVHHLLDPRTGEPVDGPWRTVSVAAETCLDANIASTAAIVRGERAAPWLQSLGLPSRLVRQDGRVRHVAGWPAGSEELERLDAGVPA